MRIHCFLLSGLILFLLTNCGTNIHINVMKPAPITIAQSIQSIVLVNRTSPKNEVVNLLEGVLTGEGINEDKQGSEEALAGLNRILSETNRFQVKRATERYQGSGSGTTLPDPMDWNTIESICKKYQTDAVILLETYDSDFIVTNTEKDVEEKNSDGKTVKTHKYYAQGIASVNLGYRLYDPKNKTITDQYMFSHNRTWEGVGNNATDALTHLIGKSQAIQAVSSDAGYEYGRRIAPMYTRVSRSLYTSGKDNIALASGAKKAQVNNWEGAIEDWKRALSMGDEKSKGRAAYNLAVANEVLGYLHESKKWAQTAYTEYDNKQAKSYVPLLDDRINDAAKLADQLGVEPNW